MNSADKNRYFATKDEDGATILCPIEVAGSRNFEDCVEEDVVRRYSGNIEADTVFLKGA